jgi:hypothetical protein
MENIAKKDQLHMSDFGFLPPVLPKFLSVVEAARFLRKGDCCASVA